MSAEKNKNAETTNNPLPGIERKLPPNAGAAINTNPDDTSQDEVMGDPGTRGGSLSGGAIGGTTSMSAAGSVATSIGATMGGMQSGNMETQTSSDVNPTSAAPTSTGSGTGPGGNIQFRDTSDNSSIGGTPGSEIHGTPPLNDGTPGGTDTAISGRVGGSHMSDDMTAAGVGPSTGDRRGISEMPLGEGTANIDTLAAGRIGSTHGTPGTGDGGTFKGAGTNIGKAGTNYGIGEPFGHAMETQAEEVIDTEGLGEKNE